MATYYVSKTATNGYIVGAAGNAGTSKITAKATISDAIIAAADGDTIMVNDGTYVDLELGVANIIAVPSTKGLKLYPETNYGVTIQSTTASAQIVSLTGSATNETVFGKFVIDAEIPGAPGTYQPTCMVIPNTSGDCTLTIAGTKMKNAATQNILNSRRRGTLNFDLVFSGRLAQGIASTVSGADVAACTVNVSSLVLDDVTVSANALARILDFTRLSTSAIAYSLTVSRITGTITAPAALGSSAAIALLVATGIAGVIAQDFDVTYTAFNTGATCYGVYIKNSARGATALADAPIIRRNRINGNAPAEYVISVGDTTTAYNVDNAQVYSNTITVPYYGTATPHCIAVGNVTGGRVFANRTNGGYVGILAGINQGASISGNEIVGCYGFPLYSKGSGATTAPLFANNTVILTNTYGACRAGGLGIDVQGATDNAAVTFQNNIIYALSDLYRYVQVGVSQAGTFVNNLYFSAGPAGFATPFSYQASAYADLAAWVAARETTAFSVDPLFQASDDYRLGPTSTLRARGKWVLNVPRDKRGRKFRIPPPMGAYQPSSGDPAATRTGRA